MTIYTHSEVIKLSGVPCHAWKYTLRRYVNHNDKFSHTMDRGVTIHALTEIEADTHIETMLKERETQIIHEELTVNVSEEYIAAKKELGLVSIIEKYHYEKE